MEEQVHSFVDMKQEWEEGNIAKLSWLIQLLLKKIIIKISQLKSSDFVHYWKNKLGSSRCELDVSIKQRSCVGNILRKVIRVMRGNK